MRGGGWRRDARLRGKVARLVGVGARTCLSIDREKFIISNRHRQTRRDTDGLTDRHTGMDTDQRGRDDARRGAACESVRSVKSFVQLND